VFIMNGLIHFGFGYSSADSKTHDDLWIYNPDTNIWTQKYKIPYSGRSSAISFVIGNKAYIGYGNSSNTSLTDFYEFDPSLLK
jgi:N-acetylneuraminic acid mutarotase